MKTFDGLTPDQLKLRKKNSEILGIVFIILGFILLVVPLLGIGAIGFGVYQVVMSSKYHKAYLQKFPKDMNSTNITPTFNNFPISDYVIIDFETTGLNPKTDRIIEIGALKIHNGEIADKFSTLVNPMKNIPKRITELTGITTDMLLDATFEEPAITDLVNFINKLPITSYNIDFDLTFFRETLNRINSVVLCNCMSKVQSFDTLKIARQYFVNLENYRLETVMQSIEPDFIQTHRALDDCFSVKKILDNVQISNIKCVKY